MMGEQVLLHIEDSRTPVQSYVFIAVGIIALCGLNDQPVGICLNTILISTTPRAAYQ
jgi:hypothetical protein